MSALGAEGRRFESCLPDHKSNTYADIPSERTGNDRREDSESGTESHGIVPEDVPEAFRRRLGGAKPRVIIGYSACPLTRAAFDKAGCETWTCDLLPARDGSPRHLQCDFWKVAREGWNGAILHPMCTTMTVSAAWAFNDPDFDRYPGVGYHQRVKPGTLTGQARREARKRDIENFRRLEALPYPTAIENPGKSFLCSMHRRPDQCVHPWQFGDDASKETGFWLDGFPPLVLGERRPGRMVEWPKGSGKMVERWSNQTDSGQNNLTPSETRWLERSETYPGIAAAMGAQWGAWLVQNMGLNEMRPRICDTQADLFAA